MYYLKKVVANFPQQESVNQLHPQVSGPIIGFYVRYSVVKLCRYLSGINSSKCIKSTHNQIRWCSGWDSACRYRQKWKGYRNFPSAIVLAWGLGNKISLKINNFSQKWAILKGLPFINHQIYWFITKFSIKSSPTVFIFHLIIHHQIKC